MRWGGVVLVLFAAATAVADGPDAAPAAMPSARQLLSEVQQLNHAERAWKDRIQRMQVTITNRRGGQSRREMEIKTKKYGPEKSRTILFFLAPADVRGIGILQWLEPNEEDAQWLLLPELKGRPRRVSGASTSESFVGTDFSYDDLAIMSDVLDWTEEDAAAALIGDADVDGHACAVIEFVPKGVEVGYAKIRLWLDRAERVMRKMEFEDRKGRTAKTLLAADVKPVGAIPTAHALEMRDERNKSSTRVVFTEIKYDTNIAEDEFSQRRLERGL